MLVSLNEPPSQKLCSETPPYLGQPLFLRLWEEWTRTGDGVLSLFVGQRGSALWCVTWTEWHPAWSDSQQEVQWTAFMAHWTKQLFLNLHARGLMPLAPLVCANEHFLWSTATSHAADRSRPKNICPLCGALQPHKWHQTVMVLHREVHCSH